MHRGTFSAASVWGHLCTRNLLIINDDVVGFALQDGLLQRFGKTSFAGLFVKRRKVVSGLLHYCYCLVE